MTVIALRKSLNRAIADSISETDSLIKMLRAVKGNKIIPVKTISVLLKQKNLLKRELENVEAALNIANDRINKMRIYRSSNHMEYGELLKAKRAHSEIYHFFIQAAGRYKAAEPLLLQKKFIEAANELRITVAVLRTCYGKVSNELIPLLTNDRTMLLRTCKAKDSDSCRTAISMSNELLKAA